MKRSHLIAVGLLALVALGIHAVRLATQQGPQSHTIDDERQVGARIGTMVSETLEPGSDITVLFLYSHGAEKYLGRTEALREALAKTAGSVQEVWAREEGHYDDFDYTESLDIALEHQSDALLIVSLGTVTHASISPSLKSFLKEGGQFYLSGSILRDAPFTKLAEQGYATILARRDTWVRQAHPAPEETTSYADKHYVLMTQDTLANDNS